MDSLEKHIRYHDIQSTAFSGEYIIIEKIHGSNFSIGYIRNALRLQKRNHIINEHSKDFGIHKIIKPLIQIVEKLKGVLNYNFLIYGEIFGETVTMIKYYDPVSATVFGSKEVFFRAFDLYNADQKMFLKYSDAIVLFEQIGLPCLPILTINDKSIDNLKVIVEKYKSAFSEQFVEGFVLKKDENEISVSRNIFKIKRKEFGECKGPLLNKKIIKSYINYNRYISAYSKIGDDLEKIKEEMIRDSLKDIMLTIRDEIKEEIEGNYPRFHKKFQKYQEKKDIDKDTVTRIETIFSEKETF